MTNRVLCKTISVLIALVVSHLSFVIGARAQTLDSARAPLLRDTASTFWHPQGMVLGFDHVLSIYEWRGAFDYKADPHSWKTPTWLGPLSDVHLRATSRFLPQDSLATTEALGTITGVQPLAPYQPGTASLAPFVTFFGSSYVASSRPGSFAAFLITKQASGFGIGGLKLDLPDATLLSLGAGLARETQSAFGATAITTSSSSSLSSAGLSATGFMLVSEDSMAMRPVAEGAFGSGQVHVDERFFRERAERYSNDSLRATLLSGVNDPNAAQNAAFLQLGLLRRDFFFSPDSNTASIKQERTEYALALADSLSYPVADRVRAHVALAFEPRDVTRRSDVSSASFTSSAFSAFSTLMAPTEVASLRLATEGRLTFGEEMGSAAGMTAPRAGLTGSPFSGEARMRYEESSESIRLLSSEIAGADEATIRTLSQTLDEASYSSRTTTADGVLRYTPTARDAAEIEGTARILSYDTPSDANHDDHDDLLTGLRLAYRRQISDELNWQTSLHASRDHLVYLKSDRSAQNAVTQSLVFNSLATLSDPAIFVSAGGEVFANYTVFDYINSLPLLSSIGNYLLRGMTLTDTVALSLGIRPFAAAGPVTLEQGVSLRVSERGGFSDSAFTERRDASVTELGASLMLGLASDLFSDAPRWNIRVGARAFILSRSGRGNGTLPAALAPFIELERQMRIGPALIVSIGQSAVAGLHGPALTGSLWYAVLTSREFDVPSASWAIASRTAQLESHLTAAWTF